MIDAGALMLVALTGDTYERPSAVRLDRLGLVFVPVVSLSVNQVFR